MESLRRMYGHRRKAGHCHLAHPVMVYLYLLSYPGLAADPVYDPGFLDEYQTVHLAKPAQPASLALSSLQTGFIPPTIHTRLLPFS